MVKIVNTLGEVKTGVQGEAVYQGRYGQQIRRTRQPKRAIPSQKQLEHRQLYREALTWRKGLSLPNRRYLDGYCIANWIVDDYKIALPWSRFALKLYLQHIGFVIVEKATLVTFTTASHGWEEQLETDWENTLYAGYLIRSGQRLTIATRWIDKLGFWLRRRNYPPGNVYYAIRRVIDDSIIQREVAIVANDIPDTSTYIEHDFTSHPTINEEVRILVEYDQGDTNNRIYTAARVADVKPDENYCQYQSSYTEYPDRDYKYRYHYDSEPPHEAGDIDWTKSQKGLLHVRHPALLSGEHRRDGKLLESWTNLSNLDEEYLTGQVGIDVFSGDELKFATIAGVEYAFRVP